ncbi:MAG: single-stranded DNA-binding protein [Christensenellales bacterium]
MDYEQMNNNRVTLMGRIVEKPTYSHEIYGEGFYESKIAVKRLSEQEDILPITISERLLGESVQEGDMLALTGQFRSYNKLEETRSRLMLSVFVRELLPYDEETNPNEAELSGYICKPPVYRTTPFKREICDLLLAVNRAFNKSDYIPCIAWGRNARFVKTLPVGERIKINGRIQSREYQKQLENGDIVVRTAYEVSISRITVEKASGEVVADKN